MYNEDQISITKLKIKEFIRNNKEKIKQEISKIDYEYEKLEFIEKLKMPLEIETLITKRIDIIKYFEELENDINILDFFFKKNATNIEQVTISLKNITEKIISLTSENTKNSLIIEKNKLTNLLFVYNDILNDKIENLDIITKVIEDSPLTNEEKLLFYSDIALKSIKEKEIEEAKTESEIENQEEKIKESLNTNDSITYETCIIEYNNIKDILQSNISKNYKLIENKDNNYINYIRAVASQKNKDAEEKYQYIEEKITILTFELLELKEEIERQLKHLNIDTNQNELEDFLLNIEIIKEKITEIEKNMKIDEEIKEQEKYNNGQNEIFYLIDENGNSLFEIDSLDPELKQKIPGLLSKLNNGLFNYTKGVKHAKLQTSYRENPVFINKNSDLACSFIRLDTNKVLILNIDSLKDIYDSSQTILKRHTHLIEDLKNKIYNRDRLTIINQKKIQLKIASQLVPGGGKKNDR